METIKHLPKGWKTKTIAIRDDGKPDVTAAMKGACIGEFMFKKEVHCEHEDPDFPDECPWCNGDGARMEEIMVPWDTCKAIYRAMVLAAYEVEPQVSKYIVYQGVATIAKAWREPVFESVSERVATDTYNRYRASHPSLYFELVRVTAGREECIAFVKQGEANG